MAVPWLRMKSVAFFICDARLAASAGGASLGAEVPAAGGPLHVAEDGAGACILRALQACRGRNAADGAAERGCIDVAVVLVQAVDGGRQHAIARVGFPLRVVQLVAAAPKAARGLEAAVPSPSEIGSQMVVPPGDAVGRAPRSRGERLPRS